MHVTAMPVLVELPVGQPAQITVSITNTSTLIDAYTVRAFGLDPAWMTLAAGPTVAVPRGGRDRRDHGHAARRLPGGDAPGVGARAERERPGRVRARPDRAGGRHPLQHDAARRSGERDRWVVGAVLAHRRQRGQRDGAGPPDRRRPRGRRRHHVRAARRRAPAGSPRDRSRRRPRRPPVVRSAQAEGALVQPRTRRAAGDGDVRPAAAHRAVADLAARPGDGRGHLRPRAEHRRRSSRRRDGRGCGAAQPGADPARRRRRRDRVGDAELDERVGRRREHRRGHRRRPGRAVPVRQRRGPAGQRGDGLGGAYSFGRLSAGRYRVRFTGAGFDEQWYAGSITFADATDIEVAAAQR